MLKLVTITSSSDLKAIALEHKRDNFPYFPIIIHHKNAL
jgi:hypothetical protein